MTLSTGERIAGQTLICTIGTETNPLTHGCIQTEPDLSVTGVANAWVDWRAYCLSQIPSFGRKVRVLLEWTWDVFFLPDITHLRFMRSHEQRGEQLSQATAEDLGGASPGHR